MKTISRFFLTALAAFTAFSCAQEIDINTDSPSGKKTITLTASVDDNIIDATATKTYLDGLNILWNDDEVVKAYGINDVYDSQTRTVSGDKRIADFTFDIGAGDEIHYAIYPAANAGGTVADMEVTIPTEQVATADSFDPVAMVAIGRVRNDGKIAFMNVGALLSIVINNDDIASVEITANEAGGESMTGTAAVDIDASDVVTTVTDGSTTSVKLTGGLVNGKTYYFVIYPGTYSNLKLVVTRASDNYTATFRNKKLFTVGRNENWKIADLTIADGKWINPNPSPTVLAELDLTTEAISVQRYDQINTYGDWDIAYGSNNQGNWAYFKMGGKSETIANYNPCYIKSNNSYDGVTSVTVSILSGSLPNNNMSVNSWGVYVYSDSSLSTQIDYVAGGTISNGENKVFTFTPTTGTKWADDSYFKVSWDLANTSTTNGIIWVDNISLYSIPGSSSSSYSVTYDANGGTGDVPVDAATYNNDSNFTVTVQPTTLTRKGYNFTGWNTAADGTGTPYAVGDRFIISSNVTLYAQWEAIMYTITKIINANGTYTVKAGGVEVSEAAYGTNLTLEATPNAGYAFSKFQIDYTKDDSTPGQNNFTLNPKPYTMPASNITITLFLIEVTSYTVSLYSNGTKVKDVAVSEGASILSAIAGEEDALTGPTGKSFVGWSTTNDTANLSYITASTVATGNINLYAVFGDEAHYQLVESNLGSAWAGDYLIAYSSTVFADGRVGGSSTTGAMGKQNVSVNPGDNLSGNVVNASWGDVYNVTLEEVSSGSNTYVLKTKDNQYNYYTSNNNGLTSTQTKETAASYAITVTFTSSSDIKLGLGGNAEGAVFRYNTAGYFRFYKNGGQSAVYLYKRQAGSAYVTW